MGLDYEEQQFIERVYKEMCSHLMRYAMASIKDRDQAEDAVQEVFHIACLKISDLMNSPNYKGWLVNTLKYVIRDHQRVKTKYVAIICKLMALEADKQKATELQLDVDLLYQDTAVSEYLQLLRRLYIEDNTMKEIAEADGITIEACKKRVQRARRRLKDYIQENDYFL